MDLSPRESFERCCRLCAEEQEVTIMIFSLEAEAMLLQNKLNKYLLIEVDEDDKLPKNICINCCTKLQTVCDFIDTAHNAQQVLVKRSAQLEHEVGETSFVKCEIKSESEPYTEPDTNVTEMEVSVDPMVVLQNSEDDLSPIHNDICDNQCATDDITYLPSADGENVTIKLIRKGEQDCAVAQNNENDKDAKTKPFPCTTCKRSFFTDLALKSHSWIHHEVEETVKTFKCNTCNESFDYKYDFINHLKCHKTTGKCQLCSRVFRTERTLEQHLAAHMMQKRSFTCKICGRSYNTKSNLKTHSITHSSDRPFKCHLCKKTFKRNQDLKFHINQHTGAKPYKCPFCDKSFASSGNCYSHRSRMHPGRRVDVNKRVLNVTTRERENQQPPKSNLTVVKGIYKYQCQICKHSFLKRDNYTYHMYQHTGEKPFQCTYCAEKFVTRRGLLIHHEKEHPTKSRPLSLLSKNVLLM